MIVTNQFQCLNNRNTRRQHGRKLASEYGDVISLNSVKQTRKKRGTAFLEFFDLNALFT
ncbi:hypothetical protein ACF8PD_02450 [Vibrio plantisponsor]|uniref:hypothetical protein n=1 Tax=Vibrio plantisponsor TaxID=664643 RepID=UPI0036F29322